MQYKRTQRKLLPPLFLASVFYLGFLTIAGSVMSSDFDSYPENQIVLMQDVLDRGYLEEWRSTITAALEFFPVEEAAKLDFTPRAIHLPSGESPDFGNLRVYLVQRERKHMLEWLAELEQLYKGYDHLLKEEYAQALAELVWIPAWVNPVSVPSEKLVPGIQVDLFIGAITVKVNLVEIIEGLHYWKFYPHGEYPKEWEKIKKSADFQPVGPPDYGIFVKTKNQEIDIHIKVIDNYNKQVGHFNGFNIPMLRAEAFKGLGDFRAAEQIYEPLLFPKPNAQGEHFSTPFELTETEKKFVRIRRATNLLKWGDYFFRRAHGLPSQEKQVSLDSAKTKYQLAISQFPKALFPLIETDKMNIDLAVRQTEQLDARFWTGLSDVSDQLNYSVIKEINLQFPALGEVGKMQLAKNSGNTPPPGGGGVFGQETNPLVRGILSRAKMQLFKIDSHLNYLGYVNGYIPSQRYGFLLSRAKEYANMAIQTESRYMQFKSEAENQEYQARLLEQESQVAGYPVQIAKLRQKMAESQIRITNHRASR